MQIKYVLEVVLAFTKRIGKPNISKMMQLLPIIYGIMQYRESIWPISLLVLTT